MRRITRSLTAYWLLASLAVCPALLATEIEVRLISGRVLRGTVIEDQTNEQQLILELRAGGAVLRRKLPWTEVTDVKAAAIVKKSAVPSIDGAVRTESSVIEDEAESGAPPPLSQLLISAAPVSSFGRIDWDSLRVALRGVNLRGEDVPLFGTLNVTLWGQRRVLPESRIVRHPFVTDANFGSRHLAATSSSYAYQHPYVASPNPNVELESWTRTISDGEDDILLLPLQRPLPDHDVRIGAFGEVTAELSMPGVGVFEANAPDVILSHQSLLRRERLDRDGSRFFPNETTSDSLQTTCGRNRFVWPGGVSGPDRGILPIQP